MPATTMGAAWMRADTGVGPAMASGSQVCRMNWPDLDMTAAMSEHDATSSARWLMSPLTAPALISTMSKVWPAAKYRVITPTIRPMSPTRLVMNALSAASLLAFSSHQWPMSTKEQTPTSSHITMSWSVVLAMTRPSIDAVNRERKAKKCVYRRAPPTEAGGDPCPGHHTNVTADKIITA